MVRKNDRNNFLYGCSSSCQFSVSSSCRFSVRIEKKWSEKMTGNDFLLVLAADFLSVRKIARKMTGVFGCSSVCRFSVVVVLAADFLSVRKIARKNDRTISIQL